MALSTVASLSSIYVPLRNPPSVLPSYLTVDRTSAWHTSALLSAAIETSTLPTRLHGGAGRLGRMGDMASFLNLNGGQKIAMLSMAVSGPESTNNAGDQEKPPKSCSTGDAARIRCSWDGEDKSSWRQKHSHIFAEATVARGFNEYESAGEPVHPETTGDRYDPIVSR
jgi:hypothetical protein